MGLVSTSELRVLAIGSCRVFRPLRRLAIAGKIDLVNTAEDRHWFTHTAAAARQYVEVMLGDKEIPLALRSAAFESDHTWPVDMAMGIPAVDVVLVEVSSLKNASVASVSLNAHRVYHLAMEAGVDYRPVINGDTSDLPSEHPLKSLQVAYTSQQQLSADLKAIRDRVEVPVMTVDHLYSLTADGAPAPDRVRLTKALMSVDAELGIPLHTTRI